jgi:hypothetical protein
MRKFLLAFGLMLAMASMSFAGLLQTQTLSVSITDVPYMTTLNFNQYNGAMTVDFIEIIVEAEVEGDYTFSNDKNGAGFDAPKTLSGGSAKHTVTVKLLANTLGTASAEVNPFINPALVLNDDQSVNVVKTASNLGLPQNVPGALIALFLGAGTVGLDVDGVGFIVPPSIAGGDLNAAYDVNGAAKVTVNFYSQVPEPSTYAMMGAGVALLGLARLRRNRSN